MKVKHATLALAAALCLGNLAGSALGADEDVRKQQAKDQIKYFDRDAKKAKDHFKYAELVWELAATKHPLVAKHLGKVLIKSKSLDRKMIAAKALADFKKPEDARLEAGAMLDEAMNAKKMPVDAIDSCVLAVGDIKYTDAVPTLNQILKKGGDPWLLVTTVRTSGNLKDKRSLPALLMLWERHPVGYSWETGEVSVDTGASGTADQDAAEAQWNAKYGSAGKGKGKPPVMLKVYIKHIAEAVKKIIGEEMKGPRELRLWMEAHGKELKALGIDVPRYKGGTRKKKKKDDEEEDDDKDDKKDK